MLLFETIVIILQYTLIFLRTLLPITPEAPQVGMALWYPYSLVLFHICCLWYHLVRASPFMPKRGSLTHPRIIISHR